MCGFTIFKDLAIYWPWPLPFCLLVFFLVCVAPAWLLNHNVQPHVIPEAIDSRNPECVKLMLQVVRDEGEENKGDSGTLLF